MYKYLKRPFDLVLAIISLIILSPLLLVISLIVKFTSKGKILFKQRRIGKDNLEFYIFKFRTMNVDTPDNVATHLLEDPDKYITKFGKFLRRTSLDELPQLLNILKGEMSFVGPRPALYNQDDLKEERDKFNVNSLIPGLTGWAQINGRDELPIQEKVKYDAEYLRSVSFVFDVKIIFRTFLKVFRKDGVVEGKIDIGKNI